jgi:uncharacterized membrane protein
MENLPLIQHDAGVLGLLLLILSVIFVSSKSKNPIIKKFYTFCPALLLCYFIPSIFNTMGIISAENSNLYYVASRYLLPASLVLLTMSIDLNGIIKLGPKAGIMFLVGTLGIILGGPIAIIVMSWIAPDVITGEGANAIWRGMSTVAGSWIGGGANQTAMKEIFSVSDQMFSAMIMVDVLVASVWLAFLLWGAERSEMLDKAFGADSKNIDNLKKSVSKYQASIMKIPNTTDLLVLMTFAFGVTGLSHMGANAIAPWIQEVAPGMAKFSLTSKFFWLIVISTTLGMSLSFTKARKMEGVGASRIGTLFLYILVATIGMKMDVMAIFDNPGLFLLGGIWLGFHAILLLGVGKLIKAPFFYIAVGSQANVGGAVSAPIVASAFHPVLAPVGVLLAVLGYALGTYGAWICAQLMRVAS